MIYAISGVANQLQCVGANKGKQNIILFCTIRALRVHVNVSIPDLQRFYCRYVMSPMTLTFNTLTLNISSALAVT